MKSFVRFLPAMLSLAFAACAAFEPTTKQQTLERGVQTAERKCELGDYKIYRPTPGDRGRSGSGVRNAPYEATIPPTYDAPSQLPSYCSDKLGK